jgi:CheY-like chemotaxis protein
VKKKIKIKWFDDYPLNESHAISMQKNLNCEVNFIGIKGFHIDDLNKKLKELETKSPDLIIIDHRLNNLNGNYPLTGSTVAEMIREKLPEIPVVGVTSIDINRDIDFNQRSSYEAIFELSKISDNYETLISIADSYSHLRKNPIKDIQGILDSLRAPREEHERLRTIIPQNLKENFNDKSFIQRLSKWIRRHLMQNPGFLYDDLWAATLLGIKLNSFNKIKDIFKKSEYKGHFADKSNTRWWSITLKKLLYQKIKNAKYEDTFKIGYKLKGLSSADRCTCYACKELYPETVAFVDEKHTERAPMHFGVFQRV